MTDKKNAGSTRLRGAISRLSLVIFSCLFALIAAELPTFSKEQGVDYLALDSAFAGVSTSEYVLRRGNHWNAVGHRMAADAIETYFLQLGVF